MSRVAETKGVSMLPEDRARWERLKGRRRTSDFVRQLLDREEEEQAGGDPNATLTKIITEQSRLPAAWLDADVWGAESAGADVGGIPVELTDHGASIDVRVALKAGLKIGPR
jgi:hypothetical protein